jgi:hypothetical protein
MGIALLQEVPPTDPNYAAAQDRQKKFARF